MNAIKRFLKNFRKHGKNYRVSDNRVKCASRPESYSDEKDKGSVQTDEDNKTNKEETSEVLGREEKYIENAIEIDEDLKNPHSRKLTVNIVENSAADDARTKEFNEILEDISKDITEAASLDEIEDVINNINEEVPKKSLFEIPRFDLLDLIPSFGSVDESLRDTEPILLDEVDLTLADPMDLDEINESKEFDTDETINSNITEHMEYLIEIDTDVEESEVISISSEDSDELKNANVENDEPEKEESKHAGANDEPKRVIVVNDEPINVADDELVKPNSKNAELENVINENVVLKDEYRNLSENDESVKFEDSPSIDSDDCGYQSSDFEFITEEEAKMDGLIINVNPSTLKQKVNKPKRVKTIEIALDQFSGQNNSNPKRIGPGPSNVHANPYFKTIRTEQNNLRNNLDTRQDNNEFIKTNSNTQANCSGQNNGRSTLRNVRRIRPHIDLHHSNKETSDSVSIGQNYLEHSIMKCTQINNQLEITYSGPSNMRDINNLEHMQVDCSEIKTDKIHKDSLANQLPIYGSGLNNLGYGPSDSQRNNPHGPINSLLQPTIQDFGPDFQENTFGNEPSPVGNSPGFQQLQEPSSLQRNCPKIPDLRYESWRALRNRNRNQFVLDHSYRNNHRILDNEEYFKLFDPNFGPLPNQSMRQMENKSTMSMSMMLVEYEGVGFDMQMMREWSDSEENEVKEEAEENARKILDMYPGENRKRQRRF